MSEEKDKIRDEQTLAKVLEAAYVLQEHSRQRRNQKADPKAMRDQLTAEPRTNSSSGLPESAPQTQAARPSASAGPVTTGSALTLAQIVEIQHQVQVRHLELENVMSLVAERLSQFAGASGAAIGILDGKRVRYRAAAGVVALPAGTEVPLEKALCVDCLRTGNVLRCENVNTEARINQDECRRRGILAMLAVPVFHDGVVAGSLELYFPEMRSFTEEDVHPCQLMAGLVTEALARNEKAGWKKSLATERAVMLDALEKLKPNLAAFADNPAFKSPAAIAGKPLMAESASTFVCRACGHELVGQEQFCGNCGSPRSGDYEAANMQSKIASLWQMQEARKKAPDAPSGNGTVGHEDLQTNLAEVEADKRKTDSIGDELLEPVALVEPYVIAESPHHEATESGEMPEVAGTADFENAAHADLEIPRHAIAENDLEAPEPTALVKPERSATWSSAATTLDFFRQLSTAKDRGAWVDFWKSRRGDIYLAIAVILFLGAVRWGMWSNHSVNATGKAVSTAHRKAAPEADLSLFDRILVKLGLAEAPDPPEYKGNPATQVWVDLQTALYYCPGADLYGKTPKGRFSSQRAARLDQFEPAYRKACD